MSDTTASSEANWRDLADMLTVEQVAEMEQWEERSEWEYPERSEYRNDDPLNPRGHDDIRLRLLKCAAGLAYENELAARYADVPHPPDAVKVYRWGDGNDLLGTGDMGGYRSFTTGATWAVGAADGQEHGYQVGIGGHQFPDGSARRWVELDVPDDRRGGPDGDVHTPTPRQARQLGAALIAAADRAEALNEGGSL